MAFLNASESVFPKAGTLAEKVSGSPAIISFLNSIHVVSSQSNVAEVMSKLGENESVITPDGLWYGHSWVKIYRPNDTEGGVLERSRAISELEILIPELLEKVDINTSLLEQERDKLSRFRTDLEAKEILVKSLTAEKTQLVGRQGADKAKFDQFNLQLKRNEEEVKELLEQIEQYRLILEESREIWGEAMLTLDETTERKEELNEQRSKAQASLEEARGVSRQTQNSVHQKQLEQQQKTTQISSLKQTIERLDKELSYKKERLIELGNNDHYDLESIEDLTLQLEGLLETRVAAEERLNESRAAVEQVGVSLRNEENARVKYDTAIQSAREKLETIRMDTQALAINKKNLQERILEDGFDVEELSTQIEESDSEENLKGMLEQLGNKITRLGSINLAAIDEFKVQSERKEHLDEQNDELVEALDTLVDAIKKIDKETRTRFKETYDQVNEGLQRLFPKIFGGGNAYLELTDDNLLETGVMIIARPPGKKNATIHLLSGGEKSLTAIALIFAIFELNPAPFCMLDEVDAPLDDANVGRFARMVKEMSSQVQFIYISHNKVSMEKADQLMGVTMHEPGVSRLVSVDIDEAAAMVEV